MGHSDPLPPKKLTRLPLHTILQYDAKKRGLADLLRSQSQGDHIRGWLAKFLAVDSSGEAVLYGNITSWSSRDRDQYSEVFEQVLHDVTQRPDAPDEVWVSLGGPATVDAPANVFDTCLYHVGVTSSSTDQNSQASQEPLGHA